MSVAAVGQADDDGARAVHRITRVDAQVDDDLLQLAGVGDDRGQAGLDVDAKAHARGHHRSQQAHGVVGDLGEIGHTGIGRLRA